MDRRSFFNVAAVPFAITALSGASKGFKSLADEFRETGQVGGLSLAQVGKRRGIKFGCCLPWPQTGRRSGPLWNTLVREFGVACPEWHLNWDQDWRGSKSAGDIAALRQRGLSTRGHALYYYQNIPKPVFDIATRKDVTPGKLGEFIYRNTYDRVKRWGNKMSYWVINETIDSDGRGMRIDPVTRVLGKDFFRIIVAAVKDAAPNMPIEMNDYSIERRGTAGTGHLIEVAKYLDKYGLSFDRVGFQCHIDWNKGGNKMDFSANNVVRAARKLKSLGVRFAITEIDVDDRRFKVSAKKRTKS